MYISEKYIISFTNEGVISGAANLATKGASKFLGWATGLGKGSTDKLKKAGEAIKAAKKEQNLARKANDVERLLKAQAKEKKARNKRIPIRARQGFTGLAVGGAALGGSNDNY